MPFRSRVQVPVLFILVPLLVMTKVPWASAVQAAVIVMDGVGVGVGD